MMKVLFVEDRRHDITGILSHCAIKKWVADVVRDFSKAIEVLSDKSRHYDAVVLDVMLPWGHDTPQSVRARFSDELSGVTLLQAMRGQGEGSEVATDFIGKAIGCHKRTPTIILSKIMEVEDACKQLGIVAFFDKLNYDYRSVLAVLREIEEQTQGPPVTVGPADDVGSVVDA